MNKGVSSLIVSILLILITISLAMAFYSWGMDISLRFRENTETMTNHTISKAKTSFFITTVSATEIGIKNNGDTPLDMNAFQVYINDTLVEVIPNVSTLQPQNVTTLNITSPFTPGNYTIKVSGPYGKYDQIFDELETISTGTTTTTTSSSTTSSSSTTTTTMMIWFSGFDKRRPVTIDSSNSLNNYQVKIDVSYDSDMSSDFSDLRFTDSDGTTELNYWLEDYAPSSSATVWVNVPSIPSGSKDIYMYYDNQTPVSSASDGDATFIWFDQFDTDTSGDYILENYASYNSNGWMEIGPGSKDNSKGRLSLDFSDHGIPPMNSGIIEFVYNPLGIDGKTEGRTDSFNLYGDCSNNDQYYWSKSNYASPRHKIRKYIGGIIVDDYSDSENLDYSDFDNQVELIWKDDYFEVKINGATDISLSCSNNAPISVSYPSWYTWQGKFKFDEVRIREYSSSEPSTTVGSEETQP